MTTINGITMGDGVDEPNLSPESEPDDYEMTSQDEEDACETAGFPSANNA